MRLWPQPRLRYPRDPVFSSGMSLIDRRDAHPSKKSKGEAAEFCAMPTRKYLRMGQPPISRPLPTGGMQHVRTLGI